MSASPISFYPSQSKLGFEGLLSQPRWEHENRFKSQAQALISSEWPTLQTRLTHSGTAALEMGTLLEQVSTGDEIILPSYTYVSSATAFAMRGCTLKFADINPRTLCLDIPSVEKALTPNTKGVLTVHYNGINPDLKELSALCKKHGIGLWGDGAMSFGQEQELFELCDWSIISLDHTKHFHAVQGGIFLTHPNRYPALDESLRNGTNKLAFDRGDISSYEWVGPGSKFEMSELHAFLLFEKWKQKDSVLSMRKSNSLHLQSLLKEGEQKEYWQCPTHVDNAIHGYYLIFPNASTRHTIQEQLNAMGIEARPHYNPLHSSSFGQKFSTDSLPYTEWVANGLLRLPQHEEVSESQLNSLAESLYRFFS